MKKTLLSIFLAVSALSIQAQEVDTVNPVAAAQQTAATVGYFSYKEVMENMPGYSVAQQQMAELREKFEAEATRVKNDFNQKYEEFVEGQKDFPPTILKKRQTELQEMMSKNIAFKEESRRLLAEAERDIFASLRHDISTALSQLAEKLNLTVVVNTDSDACPYINPSRSVNLTYLLKDRLSKQ
ncbi:MAG: OmpH family outer membrane protein [Prevotella sp.]|nr:OmpH family outer membrane protein [Prevotella sp.]